jgi:methylenetetrahydrofolate dehydrogenase (NADP+)/methenyltetrahydrofolate cyclohydrolase
MDGKALSEKICEGVKAKTGELKNAGVVPCLAVVLAGENPASLSYVKSKEKALARAGMESRDIRLPASVTEDVLLSLIAGLNRDNGVHGILVQLPLPEHIDVDKIISAIDPAKDVDGIGPVSMGNLVLGREGFLPCTPAGIMVLLREFDIPVRGAHAVIVGRSNIVGKPLANLLIRGSATVTVCHTATVELARYTAAADILIACAGKPGLIGPEMVKEGGVVIDVGINRVPDSSAAKGYRIYGDVDAAAAEKAGFITPVPGGVGPMTIAMLLQNVAQACEIQKERQ